MKLILAKTNICTFHTLQAPNRSITYIILLLQCHYDDDKKFDIRLAGYIKKEQPVQLYYITYIKLCRPSRSNHIICENNLLTALVGQTLYELKSVRLTGMTLYYYSIMCISFQPVRSFNIFSKQKKKNVIIKIILNNVRIYRNNHIRLKELHLHSVKC